MIHFSLTTHISPLPSQRIIYTHALSPSDWMPVLCLFHLILLVRLSLPDIDVLEGSFDDIWPNLVTLGLLAGRAGMALGIIQAY